MKLIKTILKAIDVAFSMYSKIPMPRFNWATEDMRYHLCFFPWVGIVIGFLEWEWRRVPVNGCLSLCGAIAIPLLVTGGFHVDGFLDTMDALHSYQDREKKLEILKDPHVGAFAIISLVTYLLLLVGFGSEVQGRESFITICFCFFLSRCLSGLSVTYFPTAKKTGMLSTSSATEKKSVVGPALLLQLVLGVALLLWLTRANVLSSLWALLAMGLCFLYYYCMSKKQFGGTTGDLAGFFVTLSELAGVIGVVIGTWMSIWIGR